VLNELFAFYFDKPDALTLHRPPQYELKHDKIYKILHFMIRKTINYDKKLPYFVYILVR
jgi:hypothetical protein